MSCEQWQVPKAVVAVCSGGETSKGQLAMLRGGMASLEYCSLRPCGWNGGPEERGPMRRT